jgi:hypothetical protein
MTHYYAEHTPPRIAGIHTSDRGNFKGCRRRWFWSSHLRHGLERYSKASPLWFGSAMHFALEHFHGKNPYGSVKDAFLDFCHASAQIAPDRLPDDVNLLLDLGRGMSDYYEHQWLIQRDPLETYVLDGIPQIEVQFEVELPITQEFLDYCNLDGVVYRGTIDRVAIDRTLNQLWLVEYKTAAQFRILHLNTDPQCTAYYWAGSCIYDLPVMGVVYQQHLKEVPKPPRILSSGRISSDTKQHTSHRAYRQVLVDVYGEVSLAPADCIACLNWLAQAENEDRDRFVRRDRVYRSPHQVEAEGVKILLEVQEMINPDTPIYPHANQHCSWCQFEDACVELDDGGDWMSMLQDQKLYIQRTEESRSWQMSAKHPVEPVLRRGSPVLPTELSLKPPMEELSLFLKEQEQQAHLSNSSQLPNQPPFSRYSPAPLPEDL